MSFVYGGYRPNPNEPLEFFSVQVEVLEKVHLESNKGKGIARKFWPHHPVVFKRSDTGEIIAQIGVPVMESAVLDDSNVFDLLEFFAYNFGDTSLRAGKSPYDITLRLTDNIINHDNPYSVVVLKRSFGCRHFVFYTKGKAFHVTVHGQDFTEVPPRLDVGDLLFLRSDENMGIWTSAANEKEFSLSFVPKDVSSPHPTTYSIKFAHALSPKEISKMQITGANKYIENADVFANPQFGYDPHLFKKHVLSDDFWYLKSGNGHFIITLIKDPMPKAMRAVFELMRTLDKESIAKFGSIYNEWLAKATLNHTGKECDKHIIIYSIEMVEKLQEHIREAQEA